MSRAVAAPGASFQFGSVRIGPDHGFDAAAVEEAIPGQPAAGDHDLLSMRFEGDPVLEEVLDGKRVLRRRNRPTGPAVQKIQLALMELGFDLPRFGADGIFGPETQRAVRGFQLESGWGTVDGIVGPITMGALDSVFAARGETHPGAAVLPGSIGAVQHALGAVPAGTGGGAAGQQAPIPPPVVSKLEVKTVRGPTTGVKEAAPGQIVVGGPETPFLDCDAGFEAVVSVKPPHQGTLFFRQYLQHLVRKVDACGRGPRGVDKKNALDTKSVYNHRPSARSTGVVKLKGGQKKDETMTDFDAPSQIPESPICPFKSGDVVALFARDFFRLLVMWKPPGGTPVAIAHRDWLWKARGGFSKLGSSWTHDVDAAAGGPKQVGPLVPGLEPSTKKVIHAGNIMQGAKPVKSF